MFTGIVQALGEIASVHDDGEDRRLTIKAGALDLDDAKAGESISVSGVCLTVTALGPGSFDVDVSAETLSCSTLGDLAVGAPVNLERSLAAGARLGGHLVSGHVDAVGHVVRIRDAGRSRRFDVEFPASIARFICEKGSVSIDGVSLTVNAVSGTVFSVNIIPRTLEETLFSTYETGRGVNLEVDLIARYLARLAQFEP